MADWLAVGDHAVRLRRNPRARRLVLRVPTDGGPPVLTVPCGLDLAAARRFALEQSPWLAAALARRPALLPVALDAVIPVAGRPTRIAIGRRIRFDPSAGTLELPGPVKRLPAQAAAFLRARAREACAAAALRHAASLGRRPGRLSLRDPRGRWGSCTSRGDLMFSWRLAMAPAPVLDYVAAHEAAHLVEMNHSARFWALVARLRPDHAAQRDWLREHGPQLHRYRFRADLPAETA